jgi:transposase
VLMDQQDDDRGSLRHPGDLTDHEWAVVEPVIPPAKQGGNKRTVEMRQIVNGLLYWLTTGCAWTAIPKDLPPQTTLKEYHRRWVYDGTLDRLRLALSAERHTGSQRWTSPARATVSAPLAAWRDAPEPYQIEQARLILQRRQAMPAYLPASEPYGNPMQPR